MSLNIKSINNSKDGLSSKDKFGIFFSKVKSDVEDVFDISNDNLIDNISLSGDNSVHISSMTRHYRPGKSNNSGKVMGNNQKNYKKVVVENIKNTNGVNNVKFESSSVNQKAYNNTLIQDLNAKNIDKKNVQDISIKNVEKNSNSTDMITVMSATEINDRNKNLEKSFDLLKDKQLGLFSNDPLVQSKSASIVVKVLSNIIPKTTTKQASVKVDGNLLEKVINSIHLYLEKTGTETNKSEVYRNYLMNMLVQSKYILKEKIKLKEELMKSKKAGAKVGGVYDISL
ncbi:MAG: hypothetical protein PHS49_07600 [Candidatus Gracilibacteria bacterium]|nr:hypothetical protein [Candidatus Gracilibacteria bacterium]